MPETGLRRSPKVQKGALIQLVESLVGIPTPNIVPFQYNPATIKRQLKPWNPLEVDQTMRGLTAPTAQPFDPEESITLDIELDASDQLEDGDAIASAVGVADRIAALEKMLFPGDTPLGALLTAVASLVGLGQPPKRPTVPVTLFVWGLGRIVPVRITSYSIEEQVFLPSLYPHQARVSLALEVLTPDRFKCQSGITVDIAIAAYDLFRLQQDALALAHTARAIEAARVIKPF
ncbi:MAG TPA: hypothetical protein VF989_03700 [Polyangiaceae bacterium]|jgi:hypothetical protein